VLYSNIVLVLSSEHASGGPLFLSSHLEVFWLLKVHRGMHVSSCVCACACVRMCLFSEAHGRLLAL